MDNLENQPSPTAPEPSRDDLQEQVSSLAGLLNSVLILLFVLGGAFDYYLFRQASILHEEVAATQRYGEQFARNSQAIEEFAKKLADYGRTHPDFAPIVKKYGLVPAPAAMSGTTAPMPAPTTNTKTKK